MSPIPEEGYPELNMDNNGCEMVHWTTLSSIHYLCHYSLKIHLYHVISMTISFISPWNRPISCVMLYKIYSIITYFTRIATEAVATGTSGAVYAIDSGPTIQACTRTAIINV